ncbi:SDR family oxidoreductase [Aneurinibacillus thermoaerophilus]|uniref:NADP-dependent 3-hydroxy acid dehydrogenase YdfG n=1 Tax=Aneurinibacillus thermoaerophilus TaxID=143495 RepID=A0A1G7XL12_ANETH|nr:SDR family oxidoreductase [Aneurinibacillus thermoaerophilus]MED0679580.1 SDR family oxidoreductase [Aneurinibacillus thermoaerophilus]MED0737421.1 SDR family oxidoreductase [Aneurinibacillus thermoaerophilus]MED0764993.1 SDR family oxidoreductase [Aneurinibacillus thermoaerophilus]QYY43806.1 SDR family oxidoreductase [Aneurinibacillus thermoaerophilus]SDG84827.1 NADP-dependent 3-hydroxy acid dehydrogenase YdfG [Aneurinibacillus thermoaerophilus]
MEFQSLHNKVVLITGASKGIGQAMCLLFAEKGATVYAIARSEELLHKLAEKAKTKGGNIIASPCDVTDSEAVQRLISQIVREKERIDVLINNAGLGHFGPIHELTETQWDEMMNVNLKGVFLCTKYVVPHLLKQQSGHIINISSVAGTVTFPGGGGYCTSKFGLMAFTDVLTQELKPHNIKVSVICPGSVQTYFGQSDPKSYALKPEEVAYIAYQMAAAPEGVIMNQVIMRPVVPKEYQK